MALLHECRLTILWGVFPVGAARQYPQTSRDRLWAPRDYGPVTGEERQVVRQGAELGREPQSGGNIRTLSGPSPFVSGL